MGDPAEMVGDFPSMGIQARPAESPLLGIGSLCDAKLSKDGHFLGDRFQRPERDTSVIKNLGRTQVPRLEASSHSLVQSVERGLQSEEPDNWARWR
jgi:hypothetical protein